MDKEILEQFQLLAGMMEQLATKNDLQKLREEMREEMADMREELREEIRASETRTKVYIENTVNKRIDSLFDGYQLTREKQAELEQRVERLEQKVEDIQNRIA